MFNLSRKSSPPHSINYFVTDFQLQSFAEPFDTSLSNFLESTLKAVEGIFFVFSTKNVSQKLFIVIVVA